MISSGRCNGVIGRTVAMPNERRIVNGDGGGGGYVNHCEMVLDDKNEMVMATSVTAGGDRTAAAFEALESRYQENISANENLKKWFVFQLEIMQNTTRNLTRDLTSVTKERDDLKAKYDAVIPLLPDRPLKDECMDVMPFTPQSSTCSSGMGDLSSAELPEHQDKPKRRKNRQASVKQPDTDLLEPNQHKQLRKRSARAKSEVGKTQEVSLVTSDSAYYTCLGDYDPIKEDPVQKNSNLEIPSWRIKLYSSWYSMEGTENMSDDIYENRHSRLEGDERKRKRWDLQNLRDMQYKEHLLKNGKKRRKSNQDDKEELTTLLPNPDNIKAIEITDKLPVSAFGVNLFVPTDEPLVPVFGLDK